MHDCAPPLERRARHRPPRATGRGAGGEIQLTDGIAALLQDEPVFAYAFEGTRYDCGSKLGYLEPTVEFALRHPELGKPFAAYLSRVAARKLAAHGARAVTLARSMVIARHPGARTVHLRLPAAVRRAMRRAGVRTLRARLRVEVLAYGTRVVAASRTVRITR